MKFSLIFVFFVLNTGSILGRFVNFRDDLTYEDLLQTNVTCAFIETCKQPPSNSYQDRYCGCDNDCSEFDNCCIDSSYRDNTPRMVKCQNIESSFSTIGYSLVSSCPPEVGSESVWKDLCEEDWTGEDDFMKLAPVSSKDTFVSYKNYYCFKCHEEGDQFVNWQLQIQSDSVDTDKVTDDFLLAYDRDRGRWTATTGDNYVVEDVHWTFYGPESVPVYPEICRFALFSDCADSWTDEDTREKCRGYTAVVYSYNESVSFRNPHCALCNFVPREDIECLLVVAAAAAGPKKHFSFTHLLKIHWDESATKKCDDNQLWDPYGKKCRRIACAIPEYVIKGGRCTPP